MNKHSELYCKYVHIFIFILGTVGFSLPLVMAKCLAWIRHQINVSKPNCIEGTAAGGTGDSATAPPERVCSVALFPGRRCELWHFFSVEEADWDPESGLGV